MSALRPVSTSLIALLMIAGFTACDKRCEDVTCTSDQAFSLMLVDSFNNNLISAGLIAKDDVKFLSPAKGDTMDHAVYLKDGSLYSEMPRDVARYTLLVNGDQTANIDLTIYQKYVATEYDCCPGYWRIDSVYARGAKLPYSSEEESFILRID